MSDSFTSIPRVVFGEIQQYTGRKVCIIGKVVSVSIGRVTIDDGQGGKKTVLLRPTSFPETGETWEIIAIVLPNNTLKEVSHMVLDGNFDFDSYYKVIEIAKQSRLI